NPGPARTAVRRPPLGAVASNPKQRRRHEGAHADALAVLARMAAPAHRRACSTATAPSSARAAPDQALSGPGWRMTRSSNAELGTMATILPRLAAGRVDHFIAASWRAG